MHGVFACGLVLLAACSSKVSTATTVTDATDARRSLRDDAGTIHDAARIVDATKVGHQPASDDAGEGGSPSVVDVGAGPGGGVSCVPPMGCAGGGPLLF